MTESYLPQRINLYAIVPYAFIPTLHKIDDKLVFGSFFNHPDRNITLQSTSAIQYLLAYTTIDKTTIEQAFKALSNNTWQQIVLDYINGIVECMPQFEQLYIEDSIRTHLANIEDLISNVEKDLLCCPSSLCPLVYSLTKFVRSLYALFFLNYTCNYNEHPIILDSDDKLEQIAKHITFKETDASKEILRRFEQNGVKITSIVSGISITELTKWIPKYLKPEETEISLRKNYYPIRDPIVFAIRRRPITSAVTNMFVDYIPVIVEFVYTRKQIEEIIYLFEQLFTQLALLRDTDKDALKLLQSYYLYFATQYYASNDNNDLVSVLWVFPYTSLTHILCNWNDMLLKGTRKYFKTCDKLPGSSLQIERLYTRLYQYIPPHIFPFIVQDMLNQLPKRPTKVYKEINKLKFPKGVLIDFGQFIGSDIIAEYLLPKLKQIINLQTDLTPMSLTTLCTASEVIHFELMLKSLFAHIGVSKSLNIYPAFEHAIEILANRYNINKLVYSSVEYCKFSVYLLKEVSDKPFTILEVHNSYIHKDRATIVILRYFDKSNYVAIPQIYISDIKNILENQYNHRFKDIKLYAYHINP